MDSVERRPDDFQEVVGILQRGLMVAALESVFAETWSRDTSSDEGRWSPNNPSHGHCAVAELVAQEVFGGDLLRYDLTGTRYAEMGSHYKLRLADGTILDFTEDQFREGLPEWGEPVVRPRAQLLDEKNPRNAGTIRRYAVFRGRVRELLESAVRDLREET